MKRTRVSGLLLTLMLATFTTGCGDDTAAEMEEAQQQVYAEYAADVLMKYNAGSNMRVLEGQQLVKEEAAENAKKEQEAKRQQLAEEYQNNKKEESGNSGNGNGTGSQTEAVSYISDIGSLFGMESFSISYQGYEVADSYPDEAGDDIFMAMDATEGKTLLVAKFAVTNTGSDIQNFDMYSKQGKFRLKLNGETIGSQYTLLLDDLSMYRGDIEAGATVETVLIFEIPEEQAESSGSMELVVRSGDQSGTILLQ